MLPKKENCMNSLKPIETPLKKITKLSKGKYYGEEK